MLRLAFMLSLITGSDLFGQSAQHFTLSGTVSDSLSGETLISATVMVSGAVNTGVSTNEYGYYSITLPAGTYTVRCSFIGYRATTSIAKLNASVKLDLELAPASQELREVEVSAVRKGVDLQRADIGVERMDMKEVEKLPMIFGERDVLKALQLMPGVKSAGDGQAGFHVRGGGADQNLVLLDEAPVYNASHLMGFFSTFNANAIKDVQLYKGSMPAHFGGRLASVLDIRMKDGNDRKLGVSGSIGTISSNLTVEGPIKKNKASFLLAARRTYADMFLKLHSDPGVRDNKLYFYDLNAKVNVDAGPKDKLYLSGYFGRDVVGLGTTLGIDWGNATGTARWNHIYSPRWFSNTSLIFSNYRYGMAFETDAHDFRITSVVRDLNLTHELSFYSKPGSTWKVGFNSIRHTITPGQVESSSSSGVNAFAIQDQHTWENALFASWDRTVTERLTMNMGMRVSGLSVLGKGEFYTFDPDGEVTSTTVRGSGEIVQTYVNPEPRLSFSYLITELSSVKGSYARMTQNMHLLSNSTSGNPTDRWIGTSNVIKPEIGDQVSGGYFRKLKDGAYELSGEVYYKWMQNQIDYRNGADIFVNQFIEGELLFGKGRAYGLELMARKNTGRLTGWIGYTLSRTERQIDGINNGAWYKARQDRTHDISIVGIYAMNERWSFSALWTYNTGNAVTFPTGKYMVDDQVVFSYTDRNAGRMPAYHRLDLSATLTRKRKHESVWNFSLYNAYGRQNAYIITFQESEHDPGRTAAIKTSLFRWVPSISYGIKF
ncbi:MAG TPA: TonB-dependent receptor [Flavobacteriales bacterium]|nr:TonB-dependent receptor [Flavobacteriales bacterium]